MAQIVTFDSNVHNVKLETDYIFQNCIMMVIIYRQGGSWRTMTLSGLTSIEAYGSWAFFHGFSFISKSAAFFKSAAFTKQ